MNIKNIIFLIAFLIISSCSDTTTDQNNVDDIVIHNKISVGEYYFYLSPFMSKNSRESINNKIKDFLYLVPAGSKVTFINAYSMEQIDEVEIPNNLSFSKRSRNTYFGGKLKNYFDFFSESNLSHDNDSHSIDFRGISEDIERKLVSSRKKSIYGVIHGSPINIVHESYKSKLSSGNFSLKDMIYPSTEHLKNKSNVKFFGVNDKHKSLKGLYLLYIYPKNTKWRDDKLKNQGLSKSFISKYICEQSGILVGFTDIYKYISDSFYKINLVDGKNECRYFSSEDDIKAIDIFKVDPSKTVSAPTIRYGTLKIGIKWNYDDCVDSQYRCDLDLHVKPSRTASNIYFKNTDTAFGWLKKIDLINKKNSYEVVDISRKHVDINEVSAYINFYNGRTNSGKISGEIRVVFDDNIYYQKFTMISDKGDHGKNEKNSNEWLKVDFNKLLKID